MSTFGRASKLSNRRLTRLREEKNGIARGRSIKPTEGVRKHTMFNKEENET
jgi:hypothetical protein